MTTELDSILSGKSAAAPASETVEEQKPQEQAPPATEAHDPEDGEATEVEGRKFVPQEALHAAKQKVKRYTEEVADLRKTIADTDVRWERRLEQVISAVKSPQPAPEQPKAPDFWEDPNKFVAEALTPVQMEARKQVEGLSFMIAEDKHGADAVKAAITAFVEAGQADREGLRPVYEAIRKSPHPYGMMVKWHDERKKAAQSAEITKDPDAYREKLKAELLAELQAAPSTPDPVMPSNLAAARNVGTRSGPAWGGPQPLNDIFDRSRPRAT